MKLTVLRIEMVRFMLELLGSWSVLVVSIKNWNGPMSNLIRVAAVNEIPPGSSKEVMAGDRIVAVYHLAEGGFFALDGICPHAGGPLGEGELTGNIVTCPWHGWQFDVYTGKHCLNDKLAHPTFPVTVDGDDLLIDVGETDPA